MRVSMYDRNQMWDNQRKKKILVKQEESEMLKLKDCTF